MTRHRRDDLAETGPSLTGDMLAVSEAELLEGHRRKKPAPQGSKGPLIAGVVLAGALALGGAFFFMSGSEPNPAPAAPVVDPAEEAKALAKVEAEKAAKKAEAEQRAAEEKKKAAEAEAARVKAAAAAEAKKKAAVAKKKIRTKKRRADKKTEKALDAALEKLNLPE